MAQIKVTSAELRRKAETLKSLNSQFKAKVGDLTNCEQSLASMWEGDAKNAFHKAFNNDRIQWNNFHTLIEQYIVTLNNIATEYDNKEAINTNIASGRNY